MRMGFTGHRAKELFGEYGIENERAKRCMKMLVGLLHKFITEKGATDFYSGGAPGFDTLVFLVVHALKQRHPHIRNILCVPFRDQPKVWEEKYEEYKAKGWKKPAEQLRKDIDRYYLMVERADEVVYVDELKEYQPKGMKPEQIGKYDIRKLQLRNQFMTDKGEAMVSSYNGSNKGGTYNCIQYAKKLKRTIINLDPTNDFEIKRIN